jgi:hypothetical protein
MSGLIPSAENGPRIAGTHEETKAPSRGFVPSCGASALRVHGQRMTGSV